MLQPGPDLLRIRQGKLVSRKHECRAHERLPQFLQQGERDWVVRHPDANCPSLLVLKPAGSLTSSGQQKRVGAGSAYLKQPELPGIDPRILPDLAQVPAHEREVVVTVGLPDSPHPLQGILVPDMEAEGVAGVRGIRDHPTLADDIRRAADEPGLRVDRMDFEILAQKALSRAIQARRPPVRTLRPPSWRPSKPVGL